MNAVILLGTVLITGATFYLRLYILYKTGYQVKAKIIDTAFQAQGFLKLMNVAKITYMYEIDGQEYLKTELSGDDDGLFKTNSVKGEPIQIQIQKKSPDNATFKPYGHFLGNAIYLLILASIAFYIGIMS